jgi:hypothetical protein
MRILHAPRGPRPRPRPCRSKPRELGRPRLERETLRTPIAASGSMMWKRIRPTTRRCGSHVQAPQSCIKTHRSRFLASQIHVGPTEQYRRVRARRGAHSVAHRFLRFRPPRSPCWDSIRAPGSPPVRGRQERDRTAEAVPPLALPTAYPLQIFQITPVPGI